ncbi:hypothetical protein ACFWXK_11855 [Streptomyces sp. NPDC059070]|uniref:hypothetical protein n=1 Tax=Streptomyces sp. NPDC059070 TaxID=3346713 RepID=UPI003693592C
MDEPQADAERTAADAAADERERTADERERTADERERTADERERTANERQERLVAWESNLDRRAQTLGHSVPGLRQRSYEAIKRAGKLLEASQGRVDRSEAALRREDARDLREQRTIDRETAESKTRQASEGPTLREVLEDRAVRLREQLAVVASALGATQDALADEYERLAQEQPRKAAELRERAERARQVAIGLGALGPAGGDDGEEAAVASDGERDGSPADPPVD